MKKYLLLLVATFSMSMFVGCDYDDDYNPPSYAAFEKSPVNLGVEIGGSTSYDVSVYTADIVNTDRTFDVNIASATTLEAAGYQVPATVTVPAGTNEGVLPIEVSDVNLGLGGKRLELALVPESGITFGGPLRINVNRTCVGTEFVVDIEFDGYASETTWSLADSEGNVLLEVSGFEDGTASASRSLCLDQGTYTFTITDSYGDGLTYPNMGSVTLSYAGEVLAEIPGDFGEGTSVDVTF
jgi:hypothetical protein